MALSYMTSLSVANDQMANQFQARFTNIPGVSDDENKQLTLRVKGSVDPPDNQIASYEVEYQGIKYSMLSAKDETDKTLTITFRLDADWSIYASLKTWMSYALDTSRGTSSVNFKNGKATANPTMYIDTFISNKVYSKSIQYDNVRLLGMKVNSFDQTSNEPSEIECTIIYESVLVIGSANATALGITV